MVIKKIEYEMDVYILGSVSYGRKNDLRLHDDYVSIDVYLNGSKLGELKTDGNLQALNLQQTKILFRDIVDELGELPEDLDAIKIHIPRKDSISKIKLKSKDDFEVGCLDLDRSGIISNQGIDVSNLFIDLPEGSVTEGIVSLMDVLNCHLIE